MSRPGKTGAKPTEEQIKKARRAIKVFYTMMPQLEGLARAITRNPKVRVSLDRPDKPAATDGETIFYFPPARLGEVRRHTVGLCDKRGMDLKQLCEACAVREEVVCAIYHEIAHICYGTFEKVSPEQYKRALVSALENSDSKRAESIKKRFKNAKPYYKESFTGVAALISPYFAALTNAVEDARIESRLFVERPGTKIMFEAQTSRVFEGVEDWNEEAQWRNRDLNSQIIVGCYCSALGYDYSEWLCEKVVSDLDDIDLSSLLWRVTSCKDAEEAVTLSFLILARLRELGYLLEEDEQEEDDPQDDSDSDEESDPEGSGGDGDGSPGGGDIETGDGPAGSPGSPEGGSGSPGQPKAGTPEDVEKNLSEILGHGLVDLANFDSEKVEVEHVHEQTERGSDAAAVVAFNQHAVFDTTSVTVLGMVHHYLKKGERHHAKAPGWASSPYRSSSPQKIAPSESELGAALLATRRAFSDNARAEHLRNLKSGHVDGRSLGKRAALGDVRLFKKKVLPGKKDYFVCIMMDVSGSTSGDNIILMRRAVAAQAELLRRVGVKFAVYAHSSEWGGGGTTMSVYHIKDADETWGEETLRRLQLIDACSGNLDGHALEFARKRLDESRASENVALYYSDGLMPAENHDEELDILKREIDTCRKKRYALLGVGIRTNSPEAHGLPTVQVNSMSDIPKVIEHVKNALTAR